MEPQLAALLEQGNFRFIYQHRVLRPDSPSQAAAEAVECAADQGKYWEYHAKVLENQSQLAAAKTTDELHAFLLSQGEALKLDMATFTTCVDTRQHKSAVDQQTNDAAGLGINGTPTFRVNGKTLTLQRSWNEVIEAVSAELKK